jgi:hypothetical protein
MLAVTPGSTYFSRSKGIVNLTTDAAKRELASPTQADRKLD